MRNGNGAMLACFVVGLGCSACGQTAPSGGPPAAAATQPVYTPADIAFGPISKEFKRLVESIANQGGVKPEDRPVISAMRDRAAEFGKQFPEDPRGIAIELKTSEWLSDDSRADDAFRRILKIDPTNQTILQSWATRLRATGRHAEAITVLRGPAIDLKQNPKAVIALSDSLFAEHEFEESLDVLNLIPAEVLEQQSDIKTQVDRFRDSRIEYVKYWTLEQATRQAEEAADDLPRVMMVTARGPIMLELFENQAPNTVANFISLIEQGFYNNSKFERVILNSSIQGGNPATKPGGADLSLQNTAGYLIPDEHQRDDHRMHFSGSLAMVNRGSPNTGGSQFYITMAPLPERNNLYTVFGRVVEGLDVVRSIKKDDTIDSITVLRKRDHEYKPATLPLPPLPPEIAEIKERLLSGKGPATAPSTQPASTEPATAPSRGGNPR